MNIRHSLGRLSAAGAAAALTVSLGVLPAGAATATWTVTPGGAFTGTATPYPFLLNVFPGDNYISCDATVHMVFKSGSGLTNPVGHVQKVITKKCDWNETASQPVTVTFSGPAWQLSALSYDSQNGGSTVGRAFHIHLAVSSADCSFVGDGSSATADNGYVAFNYTNGGSFVLGRASGNGFGSIRAYNVSGCTGEVADGDTLAPDIPLTLASPLTISSP